MLLMLYLGNLDPVPSLQDLQQQGAGAAAEPDPHASCFSGIKLFHWLAPHVLETTVQYVLSGLCSSFGQKNKSDPCHPILTWTADQL